MIIINNHDTVALAEFVVKDTRNHVHLLHYVAGNGTLTITQYLGMIHTNYDKELNDTIITEVSAHKRVNTFTVTVDGDDKFDVWGKGAHLYLIRQALKTGPARIGVQDGHLMIDCPYGKEFERVSHYTLALLPEPAIDAPEQTQGEKLFTVPAGEFADAVKFASVAVSCERNRPVLTCVNLSSVDGRMIVQATDRFVAARAVVGNHVSGNFDISVPATEVKKFTRTLSGDMVTGFKTETGLRLTCGNVIVDLTEVVGFPHIGKIFSDNGEMPHSAVLDVKSVKLALKAMPKDTVSMFCRFDHGIAVTDGKSYTAEIAGTVETSCVGTIAFTPDKFKKTVTALGSKAIRVNYFDAMHIVVFKPVEADPLDRVFLVVPRRDTGAEFACVHVRYAALKRELPEYRNAVNIGREAVKESISDEERALHERRLNRNLKKLEFAEQRFAECERELGVNSESEAKPVAVEDTESQPVSVKPKPETAEQVADDVEPVKVQPETTLVKTETAEQVSVKPESKPDTTTAKFSWQTEPAKPVVEPAPVTQEIPEMPPKVNTFAVSYATLPDLMTAKECPALQGMGHIRYFRTSKGRKVAYVASANGKCVVAYRARYERGSDMVLETAVAEYVKSLGFAA
ncbi:hypothetical protein GBK05_10610 [Bifidobacterium longum]|uniref:Uncharacterized protein n=1 Tax=Bifidobacterium longum TaxID=216816 RepID=A0A6I1BWA9_BIFLN|nr:hypothetical protein GBK09_10755 [Bifidobacterium longum]KAB6878751.1 hypothetical protein GBK40_10165 [Bifidobacterium longum]KAB6881702.1 hypothetical protein GBK07_10555 [Bifidobacterium longum]KAB6882046.1 hypothetical protein GBK43_10650 [Bifidobacterium longum]KAB6882077.1 hypothetical protein GBK01_10480 [Bifidobacterium longum]